MQYFWLIIIADRIGQHKMRGEIATRWGADHDPPPPPREHSKGSEKAGRNMSYTDAIIDNVRFKRGGLGRDWYYPLCHKCGTEVPVWRYESGTKYTCKKCKAEERMIAADIRKEEDHKTRTEKLERAIGRIYAHGTNKNYKGAIAAVRQMIDNGGHIFDSTEEIETAIVLFAEGIKFRHQVRFGERYVVDFVLDEMKVVLEIDGDIFHGESRMAKQQLRDDLIIAALGPEWEVVRIKTSTLNRNITKLPKALKTVLKKREMYRRNNEGQLPEWYNDEG